MSQMTVQKINKKDSYFAKKNIGKYITNFKSQNINVKKHITAVSSDSRPPKFEMLDINNCF